MQLVTQAPCCVVVDPAGHGVEVGAARLGRKFSDPVYAAYRDVSFHISIYRSPALTREVLQWMCSLGAAECLASLLSIMCL
jgi:hypothetical protein